MENYKLDGLEPKKVFMFFEQISNIPRESGNEKAVSDYLVNFAKTRELDVVQDSALNVIIKKRSAPGYESAAPVMLQGHIDMVCGKNSRSEHDFLHDPIEFVIDDDRLKADGTTLGADNGIGVAMMLALLDAEDIAHPALETIFTVSEETGMDGARELDTSGLSGERLINMDVEIEGVFTTSCAGGIRAEIRLPLEKQAAGNEIVFLEICVDRLKGGHSGLEIDKERANANVLMGRILKTLSEVSELSAASVFGGSRENAIAQSAKVTLGVVAEEIEVIKRELADMQETLRHEFAASDPEITINCEMSKSPPDFVFSRDTLKKLIAALRLIPNGVMSMSPAAAGLVESSCNLGVVAEDSGDIVLLCSVRSSVTSRKQFLMGRIEQLADILGGSIKTSGDYPAWEYRQISPLRELMRDTFINMYGREPKMEAVHAGLECGLLSGKMPYADMIAIGPDITGAHTPEETLSISSTARVWKFLLECLRRME